MAPAQFEQLQPAPAGGAVRVRGAPQPGQKAESAGAAGEQAQCNQIEGKRKHDRK